MQIFSYKKNMFYLEILNILFKNIEGTSKNNFKIFV